MFTHFESVLGENSFTQKAGEGWEGGEALD